jgi:hypothetical protein
MSSSQLFGYCQEIPNVLWFQHMSRIFFWWPI